MIDVILIQQQQQQKKQKQKKQREQSLLQALQALSQGTIQIVEFTLLSTDYDQSIKAGLVTSFFKETDILLNKSLIRDIKTTSVKISSLQKIDKTQRDGTNYYTQEIVNSCIEERKVLYVTLFDGTSYTGFFK